MAIECPQCKTENPDGKNFCGDCGGPLDRNLAAVKQFVEISVREQIQSVVAERYKDQKLLELETTQAIAARFSEWTKLFGFFVGIPLALLLLVLAVLGIKTYSDFTTEVGKIQTSVTAQLQASQANATKLKVDGELLATDYEKLRARFSDTTAIATQLETLSKRVDLIGEKLGFTPSSKVSSSLKKQIETSFLKYQQYLQDLGYQPKGGRIEIDIRDHVDFNAIAYYEPDKRRMVIDSKYASDVTILYREYMHSVLYSANTAKDSSDKLWAYEAIESALAWYLPCSFVGNPKPQSDATTWNLTKQRPFTEIRPDASSAIVDGTEIWGSAFWEMRQALGQRTTDKLLLDTWFRLRPEKFINNRGAIFVQLLAGSDKANTPKIREIFSRRGLAL